VSAITEVKWQGNDMVLGGGMSSGEQRAVIDRMKELDKLLALKTRPAKYKLEVLFNNERSAHKAFGGLVTWWESGSKLHGGGDSKMYMCPGKELAGNGCEALITSSVTGLNFLLCNACGGLWKGEQVHGEVYYRLPMQRWAEVILRWFTWLGMDVDIRLKYSKDDIRTVAMKEQERQLGGELLRKARSSNRRTGGIYTLERIIKDTSAGADLYGRILAFLKA